MIALEYSQIDLNVLVKRLGAGRLSFVNPNLMKGVLGIEPGSVTPFSLMNPGVAAVQVVLESAMLGLSPLNYYPLKNDQTTFIAPDDLLRFIRACGHEPQILLFVPSTILS